MKKLSFSIVLFFVSFMAIAQNDNFESEKIIRENISAFSAALMKGDHQAVADAYTADAKIFPNNQEILRGYDAIKKYWTPPADAKYKISYHKITPEEIKIIGDEAYDWGYYEGKTLREDGTESSWKGKYVIVWKEVANGEWKIYLDIWNRIPLEDKN